MNDVKKLLQSALDDLDNGIALSIVINKSIRIANLIDDPVMLAAFKFEQINLQNDQSRMNTKSEYSRRAFEKYGDKEKSTELLKQVLKNYNSRRSSKDIDENGNVKNKSKSMIVTDSVSQIENQIHIYELALERNQIPDGLHSLDLYFAKEKKEKEDFNYLFELTQSRKILLEIRDFVYSSLSSIEGEGIKEGFQSKMNKEINNKVFIVHGHDQGKRLELQDLLKNRFKLDPIILGKKPNGGAQTLIDKFEHYAKECSYAMVIFTPDDFTENNGKQYFEARPNVVFELGWLCSHLGRDKVTILYQDTENLKILSDFEGVAQHRFKDEIEELYLPLQDELEAAGMI